MSTSNSPLSKLRKEAREIAVNLKKMASGEFDGDDPAGKIAKSKETGVFKFGVAMDDKLLTIETKWADIETMTVEQMTDMIIDAMRQNPDDDL